MNKELQHTYGNVIVEMMSRSFAISKHETWPDAVYAFMSEMMINDMTESEIELREFLHNQKQ